MLYFVNSKILRVTLRVFIVLLCFGQFLSDFDENISKFREIVRATRLPAQIGPKPGPNRS